MSTHNICFYGEIRKILFGYPLLSVAIIYSIQIYLFGSDTHIKLYVLVQIMLCNGRLPATYLFSIRFYELRLYEWKIVYYRLISAVNLYYFIYYRHLIGDCLYSLYLICLVC